MTENQDVALPVPPTCPAAASAEPPAGKVFFLPIERISTQNPPKKALSHNKLIRLTALLRQYGFAEPLLVQQQRTEGEEPRYILLAGEENLHAAALAGIEKIPCILADPTPENGEKARILAQIRQKESDMFTQAAAFRYLIDRYHLTQQEIAAGLGVSQSTVANKLRLLQFSPAEREEIRRLRLSERHARALLRLQNPKFRLQALSALQQEPLTVKETEELVEALFASVSDPGGITESEQATPPTYFSAQTRACMRAEAPKMPCKAICEAQGSVYPPQTANAAQGLDFEPILPRRFALKTLQPLYNSLENALNIFRKTGKSATMTRAEGEDGIFITIHIPR